MGIIQYSDAQISGKVFRDFNANGTKDNSTTFNETFEGNIVVNAYNSSGVLLATQTTLGTGTTSNYAFPATGANSIPSGTVVRLEFILPNYYFASNGNGSNSSVQFVTAGGTANLGVNSPSDFCQSNPLIVTTSFINGNPIAGGTAAGFQAIVSVPYDASGKDTDNNMFNSNVVQTPTNPNKDADGSQVGSVWGLAYQRETQKLFAASFLKRHAGFGPSGIDAIYSIDYSGSTPNTNTFVKLSAIGIDVGTIPVRTTLASNAGDPSTDPDAFATIGKKGIGDIDISEDGKYLFVTNLNDRKVYRIFVNNPAVTPGATDVISFDPTTAVLPTCSGGVIRPFGIKIWRGKIYVGMVCSAEISNNPNDLRAYIYSYDLDGTNSAKIIDFALDYTKGEIRGGGAGDKWLPWDDRLYIDTNTGNPFNSPQPTNTPQPILSDIEFDVDGSLIIGLMDRNGHMGGHRNAIPTDINQLVNVSSGGDLLRAYLSNGSYVLESVGTVLNSNTGATLTTAGATNGQGPGNGEFYFADCIDCGANGTGGFHSELFVGGLALLPGSNEVLTTVFDPINLDSGGFKWFNNTSGAAIENYELYFGASTNEPQFGKANGLGDVEILCNPQPIEIGNLVFLDTDKDGIQDANETGINGIIIDLYQGATKVGTTTTATLNGQVGSYFFTNANVNLNGATSILPNTAYEIRIPNISGGSKQSSLGVNVLTFANQGANDLIDSDGTTSGTNAIIALTTASSGENNHSYDFGFFFCPTIATPSATQTLCVDSNGSNITVNTTQTGTNGIKFMRFANAQTGAAMYTGGTLLATVTASGGVATYTWSSADFLNTGTTQIIYYVYAILNPDLGAGCQPFQEIQIVVNPLPSFTLAQTNISCFGSGNGIITTTTTSGTAPFTYSINDGTTFPNTTGIFDNLVPATYKIAVKDNNGCVKKCN